MPCFEETNNFETIAILRKEIQKMGHPLITVTASSLSFLLLSVGFLKRIES
jgi:hypothetical protein